MKMGFKRFLSSILMAAVIITAVSLPAYAETNTVSTQNTTYTIDMPYSYPILPGTNAWKKLLNQQDKVNACQIPSDILKEMTTAALVETVLNYPLLANISAYDTDQKGFEAISSQFNGLVELEARADAGKALLTKYRTMDVPNKNALIATSDNFSIFKLSYMELFLAQDIFSTKLNADDTSSLQKEANLKYQQKSALPNIYSGTKSTYFSNLKSNRMTASTTTVKTPKGTRVEVFTGMPDFTAAEKRQMDAEIAAEYPHVTRVSSASQKYNCHSYAWYSASTSNKYWMNDPSAYMTDGSYKQVTSERAGDKVYYKGEHSAIIKTIYAGPPAPNRPWGLIECISKWGPYGLYTHRADDCPYTLNLSFWRR